MNSRETTGLGVDPSLNGERPEINLPTDDEERFNKGQMVGKIMEIWRESFSGIDASALPPQYLCRKEIGIALVRGESPQWNSIKYDLEKRYDINLDDNDLAAAWEYMRDFAETGGMKNLEVLDEKLKDLEAQKENIVHYMTGNDAGPKSRFEDRAIIDRINQKIESLNKEKKAIQENK